MIAFYPSLNIEKISVVRSFSHTFAQLNDVSYLKDEMPFVDLIATRQLRDCAAAVFIYTKNIPWAKCFSTS